MEFLSKLEALLEERKRDLPDQSYTATLFRGGTDRIAKKIGEEAAEVIVAAKNKDRVELVHEAADLLFHVHMLLVNEGVSLREVVGELEKRHR